MGDLEVRVIKFDVPLFNPRQVLRVRGSRAFTIKESPKHLATKEAGSRAVHSTSRCIIFGMAVAVAWLFVLREALNISRVDKSTGVTL